jgi:hypothetical protein
VIRFQGRVRCGAPIRDQPLSRATPDAVPTQGVDLRVGPSEAASRGFVTRRIEPKLSRRPGHSSASVVHRTEDGEDRHRRGGQAPIIPPVGRLDTISAARRATARRVDCSCRTQNERKKPHRHAERPRRSKSSRCRRAAFAESTRSSRSWERVENNFPSSELDCL